MLSSDPCVPSNPMADLCRLKVTNWCRDENEEDKVVFKGWARMALPLQAFNVVEVRKPNVGQNKPASVKADILLDTKREALLLPCLQKELTALIF